MAKSKRAVSRAASSVRRLPGNGRSAKETAKTSARSTASGPAKKAGREAISDAATLKLAGTQQLAAEFPFNAAKPSEFGDAAAAPARGQSAEPPDPSVGASTLTETNASLKVGKGNPPLSFNPGNGPLDRVRVDSSGRALTTNQGVPVADNQNSLKAGLRGPSLLEDFILREKITHFDHERIPERIVHARGSGAHGYFECYKPLTKLTRASIFAEAGKRTPVFVRFSTVAGERGSTDTARDVRGFAVKFYTDEGNWDLVGNNIPVFFIQDAMKFPDIIHAVKPEPHHAMPQAASAHDTFWDFVSLMPETTHMLMWVMSDRAIPRSYRMMQGFGVHTFRFVNAAGESQFVKFHWNPLAGTHSLAWDEAVKISGADPDFHRRDLWEAIEAGAYPQWELGVQIFSEADAEKFSFDVLDATKLIPEELVPVTPIGRMVLNRNPDNFFAETEQVAFCTAHIVPGLDFSNDPLLAGRIHSYVDTQISRLGGPNFHEIPINAPVAQVHNNQRDGMHRQAIPRGRVAYEPNSLGGGCPFQAGVQGFMSFPQPTEEHKVRGKPEKFAEHYNQATLFWKSQTRDREAAHHPRLSFRAHQGADRSGARARHRSAAQCGRGARDCRRRWHRHDRPAGSVAESTGACSKAGSADLEGVVIAGQAGRGRDQDPSRCDSGCQRHGWRGGVGDSRGAGRRGCSAALHRREARASDERERRAARGRDLAGNCTGRGVGRDDRAGRSGRRGRIERARSRARVPEGPVSSLQTDSAHRRRRRRCWMQPAFPPSCPRAKRMSGCCSSTQKRRDAAVPAFIAALTKHRNFARETDPPRV